MSDHNIFEESFRNSDIVDRYIQSSLAQRYFCGKGVGRDYLKAAAWAKAAAEQDDVVAQELLYRIYYDGLGVKSDRLKAMEWAQRAADGGSVNMQTALAYMYLRGFKGQHDWVMGYAWLHIAGVYGERRWYNALLRKYLEGQLTDEGREKANAFIRHWRDRRDGRPTTWVDLSPVAS